MISLPAGEAVILGSDPRCGLRPDPPPPGLAARHLRLAWVGPRVRVEALPGANLLVQGVAVQLATVEPGEAVLAAGADGKPLVAVLVLPPEQAPEPNAAATSTAIAQPWGPPEELAPAEAAALLDTLVPAASTGPHGPEGPGGPGKPGAPLTLREIQARAARPRPQPDFAALMAEELRRAPWFSLSILLHALMFLLLLWLVPVDEEPEPVRPGRFSLASQEDLPLAAMEEAEPEAELLPDAEPEAPEVDVQPLDDAWESAPEDRFAERGAPEPPDPGLAAGAWSAPIGGARRGDPLRGQGGRDLSQGFKERVQVLRRRGFELVFVFDTTQSMVAALEDTKTQLAHHLDVIQSLVPGARIGLVTYRDRGPREDYVTRAVPLDRDPYRALNFIRSAEANGGGDLPEAVLDGLHVAFGQGWAPEGVRVVVLVGDAPPHPEDMEAIRSMVAAFASSGTAQVHTVVTLANRRKRPDPTAADAFRKIARWGQGEAMVMQEGDRTLLARLLRLAFGEAFAGDLAQVDDLVARTRTAPGPITTELATGEEPDKLMSALRRRPVDQGLLQELVRQRRPAAARVLVDLVGQRAAPARARHAAAWSLQKMLDLPLPPVDAVTGEPVSRAGCKRLLELVAERLGNG